MTEELQSKITDEHRALIGQESEPSYVTVREEDANRLRSVLADDDPRWADGTGVAPPYAIATFPAIRRGVTPQILPGGIMTQQEWRFSRPFRIGEQLKAVSKVIDIRDRLGGRYGYSILVISSTDYYDDAGEHVGAILITVTQFDPAGARDRS